MSMSGKIVVYSVVFQAADILLHAVPPLRGPPLDVDFTPWAARPRFTQ